MKKVLCIVIPIVVVVLSVGIFFGVSIINSPKYALTQIAKDVKESGVDGLMPHLTDDAKETVTKITSLTENKVINSFLSLLGKDDYIGILKSNLEDVEWTLKDILEGKENTTVILGFNYKEKLLGTIEINMILEDGEWKINGIEKPSIDTVNLN